MSTVIERDPFDVRQVRRADGLLRAFNEAGVVSVSDVHVALRLAELCFEEDESVRLAVAFAVRGPRLGHVFVDLETIRDTAWVESDEPIDLSDLSWPASDRWVAAVAASVLVAVGEGAVGVDRPLRLIGSRLYLDRYWREERQVAVDLRSFSEGERPPVQVELLTSGLGRLFAGDTDLRQRMAAGSAVLRRFAVVAGGPGTGKTTTVARIVALLAEQSFAIGSPPPLVALAAPTGKAAARLEEAVHGEAAELEVSEPIRVQLLRMHASTIHRLLGWRPGSHSRFRHDRDNRLPHDVVIVDETSMVSLTLMSRLVEAVRPDARLILIGDPGQLTSIEAGVVLGDIVGPASDRPLITRASRKLLAAVCRAEVPAADPPAGVSIGDGIVVLDRVHRYGSGIAEIADAIRRGDADGVISALSDPPPEVLWLPVDVTSGDDAAVGAVRTGVVGAARVVFETARAGEAAGALEALGTFRLLCAHRRGPHGVAAWTSRIEGWLADELAEFDPDQRFYLGRPLLVTENDYELGLYNGDTGVVVRTSEEMAAAVFDRGGRPIILSPWRLGAVETVYAMTIHKSQGSQFDTAAVLLPAPESQILTRELLYTAVTRAREGLILVGTEEAVRAAVAQPVARASGLRERLWGAS